MIGRLIAAALILALSGCDDPKKQARTDKKQEQEDPAQAAARKAARDAEQLTMSDPERAIVELSNRIDQWVTLHPDGMVLVSEREDDRWTESYALPKSAPWTVRCKPNGIRVTLSNLFEGDEGSTGPVISNKLTRAKFTHEECAKILPGVARKLQEIFSSPMTAQR
jgi:hypothetical protein